MEDFRELKSVVKQKGFGSALYDSVNGEPVYLSRGIRELYCTQEQIQTVIDVISRFQRGDYGDARNHGKDEREGHEYGRYAVCALPAGPGEDSAIWVHRADRTLIVYFRFER